MKTLHLSYVFVYSISLAKCAAIGSSFNCSFLLGTTIREFLRAPTQLVLDVILGTGS